MPRGYITLTTRTGSKPRVACLNIGWYIRNRGIDFTIVTLLSRDLDDGNAVNDALHVIETEAEIDALIEAAQSETVESPAPTRSEFAHGMGHALGAFGGGK
jgi:hypothetical protein